MTTITTRAGKGSTLTWNEVDANFTNLNTDKAETDSPTFTGTVSGITKAMVGLGNVDNTSDVNKPVSTAQQTAIDSAVSTGISTHVGLADPHTQYLKETDASASSGSSLVGFLQAGTGAVTQTTQGKLREFISIRDFGAVCDGVTDDTVAVQTAINYCSTFAEWPALLIPGKTLLTTSINIDRLVDTTTSEFRIIGQGAGAGFYVTTAITLFTSTIAVTTDPKSEHIAFEGIQFECNNGALGAYVVSEKLLRIRFSNCFFQAIKCMNATIYAQDFRFLGCKARIWQGVFFRSQGAFAINSIGSTFEFGGDGFYLADASNVVGISGCAFVGGMFENCSGSFITGQLIDGLTVSGMYFEYNASASLSFNYGGPNKGISVTGNFFTSTVGNLANANFFEIAWGITNGAAVGGNHCTGRLHDTTSIPRPGLNVGGDYASVELWKGNKTGLLDQNRTAAVGIVSGLDAGGFLYAANGQNWTGLDQEFGGMAVGPGVIQGGAYVPIRIMCGGANPGTNNAFYGNPYWTVGSRIFNSSPVVGQAKGWICTVSGQPGTWVSEGNL